MRAGKYEEAEAKLKEANDALVEAHNAQTDLLHQYANGEDINMDYHGICTGSFDDLNDSARNGS